MYGICAFFLFDFIVNVSEYTIHWSTGMEMFKDPVLIGHVTVRDGPMKRRMVYLGDGILFRGQNYMGVSENNGTPKSSILIGFSIINHPFWGTSIFGNPHILSLRGWKKNTCRRLEPKGAKWWVSSFIFFFSCVNLLVYCTLGIQ